jgi:hypothetical protein
VIYTNGAPLSGSPGAAITSVTDGIVGFFPRRTITTATAHGLSDGQQAVISGVVATGSYDVNGIWTVLEVQSPTVFRVIGSGDPNGSYISGGVVGVYISLSTPYSADELADLSYTQSADVLTVTHPDHPPYEFRRAGPLSFDFIQAPFDAGPFEDINPDVTFFMHVNAAFGNTTLVATQDIFTADHVGSLVYIEQQDGHEIPPWEPGRRLVGTGSNTFGLLRSSDGKNYRCATVFQPATNECVTGTIRPTHDFGVESDGPGLGITGGAERAGVDWEYLDSTFGIARITGFTSATQVSVQILRRMPLSVVGGVTTAQGPWTMTGDGVDTTLTTTGATSGNKYDYEVTFSGVIQDPAGYSVDPIADVLTFAVAPPNGTSVSARQLGPNRRSNNWALGAWSDVNGYPSEVEYFGDRIVFAGSRKYPQTLWMSRVGDYKTFVTSRPLVDDDNVTATLNARELNPINELVPLDDLLALTASGEWKVEGDENGVITPTSIGFRPQSYRGAKGIYAPSIEESAVFVGFTGKQVFDLTFAVEVDGYAGTNLSVTAEDLFEHNPIVDATYQKYPLSALWLVREDGTLASLTYSKEHQVYGWAEHDVGGQVESVCCVPENGKSVLYMIVIRDDPFMGAGQTSRCLERLTDRFVNDPLERIFLDSALSYDGRNTTATTVILSSPSGTWTVNDELTLTASNPIFNAGNVGDIIVIRSELDFLEPLRLKIIQFVSTISVKVNPLTDVPDVSFMNFATTNWDFAKDTFGGLTHLMGQTVGILSDGAVLPQQQVDSNGVVTVPTPGVRVHIGLPYTPVIETLDIVVPGGESVREKSKNIPMVTVQVEETRGIFAGPDGNHLDEYVHRTDESTGTVPDELTGIAQIQIPCEWNKSGRVWIQQNDPLPITVGAIIPEVRFGGSS